MQYEIPGLPCSISLEAMSPAVPGDSKASCIPVVIFQFKIENTGAVPVSVSLMEAQQNFIGWDGKLDCTPGKTSQWGSNVNTPYASQGLAGLAMSSKAVSASSDFFGTLGVAGIAADDVEITCISQADSEDELWDTFAKGEFKPCTSPATPPSKAGSSYCGAVVQTVTVPAHSSKTIDFLLTWHFPNRTREGSCGKGRENILPTVLGNYYNVLYKDASAVAAGVLKQLAYLRGTTRLYRDTLFSSTVPPDLLDSAAGRLAVMRSATMWWNESGIVLGCEGNGCCPLNCTHVYGYTTLLERLYPDLAKDMSVSAFVRNFDPATGCTMRYGTGGWAIDGALACVIKAYLCCRQADSANTWLPSVWPNIKAQMELIFDKFDDGTGVIRVPQQNTYDTAMSGANTFIGSYWVTALKASGAMASLMGDTAAADRFAARAKLSAVNYEKICWKEEFGYYIADVNIHNCQHSYGPGCFVDQLCCIGLSSACGFGHIFDPSHEARARDSIIKYNTVTQHGNKFIDLQKHFFDGDTGITVCQYPNGKLAGGMQYETLVSSGFTSPVIAGCILDRNMAGALEVAGNLRQRHDGRHRSPWNEPECGLLYSRAMAHWNIFDQCCGHAYDSYAGSISFDPRSTIPTAKGDEQHFQCFYSVEGGWGQYQQTGPPGLQTGTVSLSSLWGATSLKSLSVLSSATKASASVNGKPINVGLTSGTISFPQGLHLPEGSSCIITLSGGGASSDIAISVAPLTCDGTAVKRKCYNTDGSACSQDNGGCCPSGTTKPSRCTPQPSGCCTQPSSSCDARSNEYAASSIAPVLAGPWMTVIVAIVCFLLGMIANRMGVQLP